MLRLFLIAIFFLTTAPSYARSGYGYFCLNLSRQVNGPEAKSDKSMAVSVLENGSFHIYNAPSIYCTMKNIAIEKGDVVAIYASNDGWVNIKYVDKNGNDYMGWVAENRINEMTNLALAPKSR